MSTYPFPKFWKGEQQDYDDLSDTSERSFCFCLTERSAKMILAMTTPLHWHTRYFSESGADINQDTIDKWASNLEGEIVAGLNSGCGCGTPPGAIMRVNPLGEVEISFDDGASWTSAPEYDPRETSSIFPLLPSGISDVTRCAAAQNVTDWVERLITDTISIIEAGGALVFFLGEAVVVFLSAGVLAGLLLPLTGALLALGAAGIGAAFTSGVYDDLLCALYCNMNDSGELTSLSALQDDIQSDIGGTAGIILVQLFSVMGALGVTNVGRSGAADGSSCGGCGCECLTVETYSVQGIDWTGGTEGSDGGCGAGRFIGTGVGGAATFTIPNRDGRTVIGVNLGVCDATLGGAETTSVTANSVASDETPLGVTPGWNVHTWNTDQDDDTIVVNDTAGGWVFINTIQIVYECP